MIEVFVINNIQNTYIKTYQQWDTVFKILQFWKKQTALWLYNKSQNELRLVNQIWKWILMFNYIFNLKNRLKAAFIKWYIEHFTKMYWLIFIIVLFSNDKRCFHVAIWNKLHAYKLYSHQMITLLRYKNYIFMLTLVFKVLNTWICHIKILVRDMPIWSWWNSCCWIITFTCCICWLFLNVHVHYTACL